MKPENAIVVLCCVYGIGAAALAADCDAERKGCKPPACGAMECVFSCRPVVKKVPVEKERFNVKCEYICVPPVQLPRFCCLLGGGCQHEICDAECGDSCGASTAAKGKFPWQTGGPCKKCDRIRKVHKLSKEEYTDGEKCVVEWKLECVCRPINCKPAPWCEGGACPAPCAPTDW